MGASHFLLQNPIMETVYMTIQQVFHYPQSYFCTVGYWWQAIVCHLASKVYTASGLRAAGIIFHTHFIFIQEAQINFTCSVLSTRSFSSAISQKYVSQQHHVITPLRTTRKATFRRHLRDRNGSSCDLGRPSSITHMQIHCPEPCQISKFCACWKILLYDYWFLFISLVGIAIVHHQP